MDNNNPTPVTPTPTPAPAPSPVQEPVAEKTGGSKMVLWFVIGLIIVVGLVGGIYYFLSKQQPAPEAEVVTQTPAPTPAENLENDLNNINVDTSTTSGEFNTVDQDLQSL